MKNIYSTYVDIVKNSSIETFDNKINEDYLDDEKNKSFLDDKNSNISS